MREDFGLVFRKARHKGRALVIWQASQVGRMQRHAFFCR
jgi:hypothetical protein